MIKFFRKIRQNLLSAGKVGRYFSYAIGEIMLVVIGILIALQINNWNDQRKAGLQEQEYYCLLLEEIKQDKQQILDLKTLTKARINGVNGAISEVQKEQPDLTVLGKNWLIAIRLSNKTFLPNDGTYQDIKSSGNLSIIKDKEITRGLNNYFKNVDGYTKTILFNVDLERIANTQIGNWFETGFYHGNLELFNTNNVFTEEIRNQLKEDLPKQMSESTKPKIYSALALCGTNNTRRLELLASIEEEVDNMKKLLQQKCKSHD